MPRREARPTAAPSKDKVDKDTVPKTTTTARAAERQRRDQALKSFTQEAELAAARSDYLSIQLQRRKEAEEARARLLQLTLPEALRPESAWQPETLHAPKQLFKVVAVTPDGRLLSVFDGKARSARVPPSLPRSAAAARRAGHTSSVTAACGA